MKRRRFSTLAGLAVIGILVPTISCKSDQRGSDTVLRNPDSLALIMSLDKIESIGQEYLKNHNNEKSKKILSNLLFDKKSVKLSVSEVEVYIKERITEDFENGNIVVVNGWILSKTEARQCALQSIN